MNLNYAIFRSEPIYALNDLAQIGSHNKREKKAYNFNPDINIELSKDNIELVPFNDKYVRGFYNVTKEYRKEYEEKMKTEREDRKKTFNQMLNKSQNVVADELMFTTTNEFFKNMTREDIKEWANTCMEFVSNDLGYKKEQVLHATIHMDEKIPHIHCVVSPLYECFTTNQNNKFLLEWFNSKYFRNGTVSRFGGGVRNTLNFSILCEIEINLPTIDKQNQYASYLSKFDEKINLETEKLNKLNNLKKGLMKNMFV